MKFEDLCKRNKTFFIIFILLGSLELFLGIIRLNYYMIIYSFWIFLEAFHVINSQLSDNIIKVSDNIIKDYENMMGLSITNNHEIEKMVCKAIKNNDTKLLNKFVELVEERDKKDGC